MNIAILGSGTGSNAEAILRAWQEGRLGNARPVGLLCDNPQARMLTLGEHFGVPARFLEPGPFKTRMSTEAEEAYVAQLRNWDTDLVVLAGFMRVIKAPLLNAYAGRIINLHPSLLPKYPGLHSIARAFEAGERESGCTVHWVNATIDGGAIIAQRAVSITPEDNLEALTTKVHSAEHELLPAVICELSKTGLPQ